MKEDLILKIIRLCRQMDETSQDLYMKFHHQFKDEPLHTFWLNMSKEESEHVKFWQRAEQTEELSCLPNFFEDAELVVKELEHAAQRTGELQKGCDKDYTVAEAFLLAYRM